MDVIARWECEDCGTIASGSDVYHSRQGGRLACSLCDGTVREWVPAEQLEGAVEALQAVEDYFRRPLSDDTETRAADRLSAVLEKVHAALGGQ